MLLRCFWTLLYSTLISEEILAMASRYTEEPARKTPSEKFAALLNLYKINPLRHSNVFKTFSDRMLLPNKEKDNVLHFDSKENTELSEISHSELKRLEEQLHVTNTPTKKLDLEIIKAPQYGISEKIEQVSYINGLLLESTNSVENEYSASNNTTNVTENVEKHTVANTIPDSELLFDDNKLDSDFENEIELRTKSIKPEKNKPEIGDKLNISIVLPGNATVEEYLNDPVEEQKVQTESSQPKVPQNLEVDHNKDADASVLAI